MSYCLYCYGKISTSLSWVTLFSMDEMSRICHDCLAQIQEIAHEHCHYCYKVSKIERCEDCLKWIQHYEKSDPLQKNVSIYQYNDTMKEIVAKWKYRGDVVLGEMFAHKMQEVFVKEFHYYNDETYTIMPIPLSDERLYERNFNQAKQLASFITTSINENLVKIDTEKQSKKTRHERLQTTNPFKLIGKTKKNVILVDDIYTTGQTVRHAASLLKTNGCESIYAFTLVRG